MVILAMWSSSFGSRSPLQVVILSTNGCLDNFLDATEDLDQARRTVDRWDDGSHVLSLDKAGCRDGHCSYVDSDGNAEGSYVAGKEGMSCSSA